MATTKIEWADRVWNPVTGCSKVSQGCKNCYAERIANRFWGDRKFTDVQCHPGRLDQPLHWKKPSRIFVNSMSDLFHEDVPFSFVDKVFVMMQEARKHTYQILTKRPDRMLEYFDRLNGEGKYIYWEHAMREMNRPLPSGSVFPLFNVWLNVSCEDQQTADERIPYLLQTPAAVRGVSCEPLLGEIDLSDYLEHEIIGWQPESGPDDSPIYDLESPILDWVICGGESGRGARPMHPDWARSMRDQCQAAGVPFFFKQFGEWKEVRMLDQETAERFSKDVKSYPNGDLFFRVGKKVAGRLLDGREWNEFPEVEHVRP